MKDLVWDKTLSVDVPEIDQDHRRLLELFNRLGQAVEDREPQAYIESVMEELIACTGWHFQHEERLMERYAYPGLHAHRAEHAELIESGRELLQQLKRSGVPLSSQQIESLEHWLTGHIYGTDMAMGSYLAEAM